MLNIGDRIWLSSGYDVQPSWLEGGDRYSATVLDFKEFAFSTLAVAKLNQKIKSDQLESDIILMQLRHKNAVWEDKEHAQFLG